MQRQLNETNAEVMKSVDRENHDDNNPPTLGDANWDDTTWDTGKT